MLSAASIQCATKLITPCVNACWPNFEGTQYISARYQRFYQRIFTGYLLVRDNGQAADLVHRYAKTVLQQTVHQHQTIQNHTIINRHQHYQFSPVYSKLIPLPLDPVIGGIASTVAATRRQEALILAARQLLAQQPDNKALLPQLDLAVIINQRIGQQHKMALSREQRPAKTQTQYPSVWEMVRLTPLLQLAEEVATRLLTRKNLTKAALKPAAEDRQNKKVPQTVINRPLVLNTYTGDSRKYTRYRSSINHRLQHINNSHMQGLNSPANLVEHYNDQYRIIRQNLPYAISNSLGVNLTSHYGNYRNHVYHNTQIPETEIGQKQRSDSNIIETLITQRPWFGSNQIHTTNTLRQAVDKQRIYQRFSELLTSDQYSSQTIKVAADSLKKSTANSGLFTNKEQNSGSQILLRVPPLPHSNHAALKEKSIISQIKPEITLPGQSTLAIRRAKNGATDMVYNHKNSKDSSLTAQILAINSPEIQVAPQMAIEATGQTAAPAATSLNEPYNRPIAALSKKQTRQVANEVYQLINQRLRFEKRRRGLS
ncbi:MAG: hypothetical protein RPS47_11570 [Colwellia sp.]